MKAQANEFLGELPRVALCWMIALPLAGLLLYFAAVVPSLTIDQVDAAGPELKMLGYAGLILWISVFLGLAFFMPLYATYRTFILFCGPVFEYEVIRGTRSARVPLLRVAYALTLLLSSFLIYIGYAAGGGGAERSLSAMFEGARIDPNDMANFAGAFFNTFLALQIGLVFLLTPAFVAGAVAAEKQSGTLDYLLTTDLTAREIVLGKLASRVSSLLLLLLTGLPVLCFLQLLGGVDPRLLLAGFIVTLITLVSQGAMSIATSVMTTRPRSAVFSVYLITATYLVISYPFCCCSAAPGSGPFSTIGWIASGNPVSAWSLLSIFAEMDSLEAELPWVLGRFAIFHAVVTLGSLWLAVRRVRPDSRVKYREVSPRPRRNRPSARPRRPREQRPRRWRPWIGDRAPMLWKELHYEPGMELPGFVNGVLISLAVLVLSGMAITFLCGLGATLGDGNVGEFSQAWVWICSGLVGQVLLLGIALRGAGTFSKEKEQQTLDSLLTTPLTDQEILWAKWAASLWSVRWWGISLVILYVLALITGGLSPLAIPLLLIAFAVHAAFAASLGTYCSLVTGNTLRSMMATVVALAAAGGGHWLLALVLQPLAYVYFGKTEADLVFSVHLWGLTPPCNLAAMAFSNGDLEADKLNIVLAYRLVPGVCGILLYGLGTVGLLWGIRRRMQRYRD